MSHMRHMSHVLCVMSYVLCLMCYVTTYLEVYLPNLTSS